MNLMRGIDLKKIAGKMNGASGAELKAVCTEAGMFALRERRVHVTQEDFEMAVAKVMKKETEKNMSLRKLWNVDQPRMWFLFVAMLYKQHADGESWPVDLIPIMERREDWPILPCQLVESR
ncbi:hypothetical protein OIU84_009686, partial [Salix udensis]